MYVLHLTEVLLINTKMKLCVCVCVCAWMFERKAVIPTEYKAARFLQGKEVFSFFLILFLFF